MSFDWSNKEKIALLSDLMEFGDQPESWPTISNDLSKTFQTKKEGRYSIKVRLLFLLLFDMDFSVQKFRIANKSTNIFSILINPNGWKIIPQIISKFPW